MSIDGFAPVCCLCRRPERKKEQCQATGGRPSLDHVRLVRIAF